MLGNGFDGSLIGREQALEQMWSSLQDASVLLMGPRRIGKTELLKEMCSNPAPGCRAVRVNVEGCSSVQDAMVELQGALERTSMQTTLSEAASEISRVEAGPVALQREPASREEAPWRRAEATIRGAMAGLGPAEGMVLLLDEVPRWLDSIVRGEGAAAARQALGRLRQLRHREWEGRSLRMVFTGSVGLAGIARSIGASAEVNDLMPLELGPLALESGALLFELQLVQRCSTVSEELATMACRLAGGSPHWIKMLASRMPSGQELAEQDLSDAVESLLSPRLRHLFDDEARQHFVRRYGASRTQVLRSLLSVAARSEAGADRQSLIAKALAEGIRSRDEAEEAVWALVDSFHLEHSADMLRFSNPLFRRWWLRYGEVA